MSTQDTTVDMMTKRRRRLAVKKASSSSTVVRATAETKTIFVNKQRREA